MTQAQRFRAFGLAAIGSIVCLATAAQTVDTTAIQQKLNSQFKLSTTTADRTDLVTAGDVVQLHKPGLMMYAVASPLPPSNTYKNGRIGQGWGGFGKDLAIGMAGPAGGTANDYPHRPFVAEEKCWVTGIQVQSDGVLFQLYSDPYNDIRYYGNLKIPFPGKKAVPAVDVALQAVAEVLTVVPQDDQGGQQPQSAAPASGPVMNAMGADQQGGIAGEYTATGGASLDLLPDGTFKKTVGGQQGQGKYFARGRFLTLIFASGGPAQLFTIQDGNLVDFNTHLSWVKAENGSAPMAETASVPAPAPAPAPLPEIAPPPPPADAPPPTIAVGQTKDQVTAAFGQPARVAKIGVKEIYYYADMKVTFLNGKVSNVE